MHLLHYLPLAAGLAAALPHATPKKRSITLPFSRAITQTHSGPSKRDMKGRQGAASSSDDVSELWNNNNARYLSTTILAGQEMTLILDTGSSDTFVFSVMPEDQRNMSLADVPPLFNNETAVGVTYLDLVYNATYGEGDGITTTLGAIGMTEVKLNGTDLVANNLTFANLYHASSGTGGQGLLGLGFPFLSDIFWGSIWAHNATGKPLTPTESQKYFPLVPLLHYQQKIEKPLFGLIADRIPSNLVAHGEVTVFNYTDGGGSLTIGDFPEGYTEKDFTWSAVPMVKLDEVRTSAGAPPVAGYKWEIAVDFIYFNGKRLANTTEVTPEVSDNGTYYALVDTGNPAMSLPVDVMAQITDAWAANPGNTTMPCDSDFELIIQIGGTNFTMAKEDMVVPSYQANDGIRASGRAYTNCQFQAQPVEPDEGPQGTGHTYAFGDTFLRNVVTMFDYGNLLNGTLQPPRMGFAQR